MVVGPTGVRVGEPVVTVPLFGGMVWPPWPVPVTVLSVVDELDGQMVVVTDTSTVVTFVPEPPVAELLVVVVEVLVLVGLVVLLLAVKLGVHTDAGRVKLGWA